MRLLPVSHDAEWENLLEAQPGATLYHTLPWLRLQERQFGYRLFPLVIHHQGQRVGVFPLFLVRRGIFRVSYSPRGLDTLFLGPLVAPNLLPELLDCYEGWARSRRVDYTAIAFTKEIDAGAATVRGYVCDRLRNCCIDLRGGEDAVFQRMSAECRRRIRRAERLGVRVVEGDLAGHLDRYVGLSSRIFAKAALPTGLTRDRLADMLSTLSASGRLLSLRAEVDGQVAGMYIAAQHRRTLYALDTVTDYRFRDHSTGNLMNWHALKWGCRGGLEVFDFAGANTPSIALFKASLGAVLTRYSNITKAHSRLARWAIRLRGAPAGLKRLRHVYRKIRILVRRHTTGRRWSRAPAAGKVTIGTATWTVEVAMTAQQRYVGLGGRRDLPGDSGMLFVYPDEREREYTMRGCTIPLDIAFLSCDLRVVAVRTMAVEPDRAGRKAYRSGAPAQYVLEVAAGHFARAGVRAGCQAHLSSEVPPSKYAEPWP